MNPLYFVRYEAKVMLVDCLGLSVPAELAHRRLCDWCWAQGHFPPAQAAVLAEVTRVPPRFWERVFKALHAKGWAVKDGTLFHSGVQRILTEGEAAHAAAVSSGRRGAHRRWHAAQVPGPQSTVHGPQSSPSDSHPIAIPSQPCSKPMASLKQSQSHSQSQSQSHPQHDSPAERSALNASAKRPRRKAEEAFMSDLNRMLLAFDPATAPDELNNWGGWWRNRFRENPDKATRVLADIRSQVREQNISKTPGAAAIDLWNRLP